MKIGYWTSILYFPNREKATKKERLFLGFLTKKYGFSLLFVFFGRARLDHSIKSCLLELVAREELAIVEALHLKILFLSLFGNVCEIEGFEDLL